MKTMGRWQGLLSAAIAVGMVSSVAQAAYVVSIVDSDSGLSSTSVAQGGSVMLDVVIVSNAGDAHDSFAFGISFDPGGLMFNSYTLVSPEYVTGGANDFSTSAGGAISSPLHFEALTETPGVTFGEGTLVELLLGVPNDFLLGDVLVNVQPDSFGAGFSFIESSAGQTFTLSVTPEPATLALLAIGGIAVLRRRHTA